MQGFVAGDGTVGRVGLVAGAGEGTKRARSPIAWIALTQIVSYFSISRNPSQPPSRSPSTDHPDHPTVVSSAQLTPCSSHSSVNNTGDEGVYCRHMDGWKGELDLLG